MDHLVLNTSTHDFARRTYRAYTINASKSTSPMDTIATASSNSPVDG